VRGVLRRLAMLGVLAGCSFTPPTPRAYVRFGPARDQLVTPLAALPVTCGTTTMGCLEGYKVAVASATRIAIEYAGFTLVDGERINAELQQRTTQITETADRLIEQVEITGRTWVDLEPQQQRDLLTAMGIRGLFRAEVSLGVPRGMAAQRTVTVAVAVTRLADEALAWQSQCSVETGDYHSEPQAIELATRCALESVSLW
jgi:hypothetical protein